MKGTRTARIRLGIFLITAGVLLVGAIIALAGRQLWGTRDAYVLRVAGSVSGLEVGAPVRVLGVRRGSVSAIRIVPETLEVEVRVELRPETPLHEDAQARLGFLGITGLKYVEVEPGTVQTPLLPPGSALNVKPGSLGGLPSELSGIVEQTEKLLENINALVGPDNRDRIIALLDAVTQATRSLATMLEGGGDDAEHLLQQASAAIKRLDGTLAAATRLADAALPVVQRADNGLLQTLNEGMGLIASLQRAARELELLLRQIRSDPSTLIRGRPEVKP